MPARLVAAGRGARRRQCPADSASFRGERAASADEALPAKDACAPAILSRSRGDLRVEEQRAEQDASPSVRAGRCARRSAPADERAGWPTARSAAARTCRASGKPRPGQRGRSGRRLCAELQCRPAPAPRLVVPADVGVADRRHGAREVPCSRPARRSGVARSRPCVVAAARAYRSAASPRRGSFGTASGPSWRRKSSGSCPSGRSANCTLLPGFSCGRANVRRRERPPSVPPRRRRSRGSARRPSARACGAGLRSAPCRAARRSPRSRPRRRR